ncbi:hypothetical protein Tco_1075630, partial [Tanacetum coccineum]
TDIANITRKEPKQGKNEHETDKVHKSRKFEQLRKASKDLPFGLVASFLDKSESGIRIRLLDLVITKICFFDSLEVVDQLGFIVVTVVGFDNIVVGFVEVVEIVVEVVVVRIVGYSIVLVSYSAS